MNFWSKIFSKTHNFILMFPAAVTCVYERANASLLILEYAVRFNNGEN